MKVFLILMLYQQAVCVLTNESYFLVIAVAAWHTPGHGIVHRSHVLYHLVPHTWAFCNPAICTAGQEGPLHIEIREIPQAIKANN